MQQPKEDQIVSADQHLPSSSQIADKTQAFSEPTKDAAAPVSPKTPPHMTWYVYAVLWGWTLLFFYYPAYAGFPKLAITILQYVGWVPAFIVYTILINVLIRTLPRGILLGASFLFASISLLIYMHGIILISLPNFPQDSFTHYSGAGKATIQIISFVLGFLGIFFLFVGLAWEEATIVSILRKLNTNSVSSLLLGLITVITTIVPFMQLLLSLLAGKH